MKSGMNFVKGMGLGAAVGMVSGAVGYAVIKQNKHGVKKNVSKALKSMSQLVDNVGSMF